VATVRPINFTKVAFAAYSTPMAEERTTFDLESPVVALKTYSLGYSSATSVA
jgi:hypothetical protein